mgnify:CR=1 FL=1
MLDSALAWVLVDSAAVLLKQTPQVMDTGMLLRCCQQGCCSGMPTLCERQCSVMCGNQQPYHHCTLRHTQGLLPHSGLLSSKAGGTESITRYTRDTVLASGLFSSAAALLTQALQVVGIWMVLSCF